MGFDPVERSKKIENLVMKDGERKYYRFRYSLYYGGIVTADSVGCNLLCAYCWNYFKNMRLEKVGDFFSPEEVAEKLVEISRKEDAIFSGSAAQSRFLEENRQNTQKK